METLRYPWERLETGHWGLNGDRFSGRPTVSPTIRPTTCSRSPAVAILSPLRGVIMTLPTTNAESLVVIARLGDLPPKPPRSKLEPHSELIRELRRKGRTYREVARLFHERLGLYVAPSTLHSFVKVRAKHHKRTQFELPPMELTMAAILPTWVGATPRNRRPPVPVPGPIEEMLDIGMTFPG